MKWADLKHTTAWPLLWLSIGLIGYASLYPFEGWRVQGVALWHFVWQPWPRYWTGFDLISNVLGYMPLGFFAALVALRRQASAWAVAWALALAAGLSFALESLQMLLPLRVPSNLDWGLNVVGAGLGAWVARTLMGWGLLMRWSRWRGRWFVGQTTNNTTTLVLLALWPVALLFPSAVPFGLGQVHVRLEAAWVRALADTPWQEWLPMHGVALQPLWPLTQVLCMAIGLLLPCLLAFGVLRTRGQRATVLLLALLTGVLANSLSAALSYGPLHAWAWMGRAVWQALCVAAAVAAALLWASPRLCWVMALVGLVWQLSVLNQASANVYFAQTLQLWEQGQFIRFYGLAQWLGWLWPYALLWHLVQRLSPSWTQARLPAHASATATATDDGRA